MGITKLADRLGIAKSTAHSIVSTFERWGYIQQLPNKKYTLGFKMLEYAYVINQNLGYPKKVYDLVSEAANLTGQIVYFGLPYGSNVLYLYVAYPMALLVEMPYREILGEKALLCVTGIGKAILACLPEEEWEERIPEQIPQLTPNTIVDREGMISELRRTRRRGFSIDDMEHEPNIRCVGVPVYSAAGELVAGMSASGPSEVMTDEKLLECASILRSISIQMKERIDR